MNALQNKKLIRHDGSPVWIRPINIKGMIAVNNGKQTRITLWKGDSILVNGSIVHVLNELEKEERHYEPEHEPVRAYESKGGFS